MKRLTLGAAYRGVERIVPSRLLKRFKKTSAYRKISDTARRSLPRDNTPSWQMVSGGPLKGVNLFIDPTGEWQKEMLSGNYDPFFVDFVDKLDLAGKTVYDVGAHIGLHSLYFAARVGPKGNVIAFEPNTSNVTRINMHIERNPKLGKRITVLQKAVSNVSGRTNFIFSDSVDDGSSMGGFVEESDPFYKKESYEEDRGFRRTTVETTTIDEAAMNSAYPPPSLIKIDIEGGEYLAAEGAKEILRKYRPILLIEIHSALNRQKVPEILERFGYTVDILKEDRHSRCFMTATPPKKK